jgi:phosphatidylglycerophosphate synthase
MYDHLLRHPKRVILSPLARALPISPNTLTLIGLLFGLAAAFFSCVGQFRIALALWCINRVVDGLDGEVARASNTQSDLGGYLDILADLLVYALIPVGMACHANTTAVWLSLSLMLASFYLNVGSWMYLSSILEKRGIGAETTGELTTVSMPRGLVEGGETLLFFTLFLSYPSGASVLFSIFAALTFMGAALRVRWAQRTLPVLERATLP